MRGRLVFLVMGIMLLSFSLTFSSVKVELGGKLKEIDSYDKSNLTYISLTELNELLGGEFFWNQLTKKGIWQINQHQLAFSPFSPYILVDSSVFNLVGDVEFKKGTLYAPIQTFEPVLDEVVPQKIDWDPKEGKLSFLQSKLNILDMKVSQKTNGVLIEINLTQPLEYHLFLGEPRWVNVNFYEGKLDTSFFSGKKTAGLLDEIKAYQFDNSAQLSFKAAKDFHQHLEQIKFDPPRLQISLEDTNKTAFAMKSAFNGRDFGSNPINVIVIDPGHGGADSGAIGSSGLVEKDVTLDIAKKLAEYLRQDRDLKVILTRTEDVFVPLEERSNLANQTGGDIFISIHTNSARRKAACGFETFFLEQSRSDEARAVAALENASLGLEKSKDKKQTISDLDFILLDMVQNEYLKESSDLASIIQKELGRKIKKENRGVSQAEFVVLNKTYMPATLVEVAFISNQQEEKLLKKSSFRKKIAEALKNSIREFKRKYEAGMK